MAIGFSMDKTLERYRRCSYEALEVHHEPAIETQVFTILVFELDRFSRGQ